MAQPLRTVGKARDLVRGMTAGMTADITVYLRGGTYQQTSTLAFTNADSGQNGHYVKYLAYTGEQPIITGGAPITGLDGLDHRQRHLHRQRDHHAVPAALRQRRQGDPRADPEPRKRTAPSRSTD